MDKSGKIKIFALSALIIALMAILVYGFGSSVSTSPTSSFTSPQLSIACNASPTSNYNITNISFWFDLGGTWHQNASYIDGLATNLSWVITHNLTNVSHGVTFKYGCQFTELFYNQSANASNPNAPYPTDFNRTWWSDNTTINVLYNLTTNVTTTKQYSTDGNFTLSCNSSFSGIDKAYWNVTNVTLWTNLTGSWIANTTNTTRSANGTGINSKFRLVGLADGVSFKYGCRAFYNQNDTINTYTEVWSLTNGTAYVERVPNIAINAPANNAFLGMDALYVNFTPTTTGQTLTSENFACGVYTNDSDGNFSVKRQFDNIVNATSVNATVPFDSEGIDILFGVRCWEKSDANINNASINRTVRFDRTAPVITLNYPTNNSYFRSGVVFINATVRDNNVKECTLFGNFNASNASQWISNLTMSWNGSTGEAPFDNLSFNFTDIDAPLSNGSFNYTVWCVDNASNTGFASFNYTFNVDTLFPNITALNFSSKDNSTSILLNANFSEAVNLTVKYGNTTLVNSSVSNSSYAKNFSVTIPLGNDDYEKLFYVNVSFCDLASNCNNSAHQYAFIAPRKLSQGWNAYAILQSSINLSQIGNQINYRGKTVYLYWWNATRQAWNYSIAGATAGGKINLTYGQAVWIYEPVNGTWFYTERPIANPYAFINLTRGSNFIGLTQTYSFYNLSASFMNYSYGLIGQVEQNVTHASYGNIILNNETMTEAQQGQTCTVCVNLTNFTYYSWYNNTNQKYASYKRNLSWFNTSLLGRGSVVFVFSPVNVTWNGTTIIANWTG